MPARHADLADALDIPLPEDGGVGLKPDLRSGQAPAPWSLDGCRRLLGPNLYGDATGAVGDGYADDPAPMLAAWETEARALMAALGWAEAVRVRPFAGGGSLYVSSPADRLMTAAFLVEGAFSLAAFAGQGGWTREVMAAEIARVQAMEANPGMLRLLGEAEARGIDRLLDDEAVTLGHGTGARTFGTLALPQEPDWTGVHDIPLALVTGTNGKTTTVRLIAAIAQAAGKVAGLSSTELVRVGDDILDRGDYSGPAGARLLLRDRRLEIGVLEVARGGILRRGVPVRRARAAVVTNVAADHLGQYGITTVEELAQVKLALRRGLAPGGWLILNAGDATVRETAQGLGLDPVWFALDPDGAELRAARAAGRPCGWLLDGMLTLSDGLAETRLMPAAEVPLTLGGAARYNIENALGAALAARALGLPNAAIRTALARFRSDATDNPGRANEFAVNGARVFVDFAHNPHSIAAVTSALAALPAKRRFVLVMHAGNRSDAEIAALVTGAFALRPDIVVAAENPHYLRGRAPGEVPAILARQALALGLPPEALILAPTPLDGARAVVARLAPGDLALLLVHDQRADVFAMLEAAGRQT